MTILTRFIVQCDPCERYLPTDDNPYLPVTADTGGAAHFLDFSSAYNEAVRRGWCASPLICGECAAEWREKVLGEPEDSGTVRDPGESPQRA
jgi:hypothetical protein